MWDCVPSLDGSLGTMQHHLPPGSRLLSLPGCPCQRRKPRPRASRGPCRRRAARSGRPCWKLADAWGPTEPTGIATTASSRHGEMLRSLLPPRVVASRLSVLRVQSGPAGTVTAAHLADNERGTSDSAATKLPCIGLRATRLSPSAWESRSAPHLKRRRYAQSSAAWDLRRVARC